MLITFMNNMEIVISSERITTMRVEETIANFLAKKTEKEENEELVIRPIGSALIDYLEKEASSEKEEVKMFRTAVSLCLDYGIIPKSKRKNHSPAKNFYIWREIERLTKDDLFESLMDKIKFHRVTLPIDPRVCVFLFGTNISAGLPVEEKLKIIRSEDFQVVDVYESDDIAAICYISLMEMIKEEVYIRECPNCKKPFIITGRIDTEYCDRTAPDYTDKTCKDVGPLKEYQRRIESNPLMLAYQKAYKSKHAALLKIADYAKRKSEEENLKQWRIAAKASAEKGEVIEEFKKWLK